MSRRLEVGWRPRDPLQSLAYFVDEVEFDDESPGVVISTSIASFSTKKDAQAYLQWVAVNA